MNTFMEAYLSPPTEDVNKADGRPKMEFSDEFKKTFDESLSNYDDTLKYLSNLVSGKGFTDDFGVCSCRYQMMYLTPKDLSSFIDMLFKAISKNLIECTPADIEKLAVEASKQFIATNTGLELTRDNLFANSTYEDPRVETMMDILVQIQNAFFERHVYSKFEMQERAKSMNTDLKKITDMKFSTALKAVVNALPSTIKDVMKDSMADGIVACNCDLVMLYIEMFILFMCALNTTLLEQMISYAQPRSTFLRKSASKFVGETFADTAFNGYITECCMLKTNTMNIRSRIPFDCNMRNIVLQDVTPNFKDTKSALFFMLRDSRSPIHILLAKYASNRKLSGSCESVMSMFRQYFHHCDGAMNPLHFEYEKAGFRTDVNWLDKIAYGNQFLDGNYRMDAMGNDNRHPIRETLQVLHRMYCGCGLRTNEELANNIIKISDAMNCMIMNGQWGVENRALMQDILATLGDCFTRNALRLYNNNATIVAFDDVMPDTMTPGYSYCEYFVMEADAKPSVEISGTQNTAPKNSGLSKLGSALRQFAAWVRTKFAQFFRMFFATNDAKIKWITSHKEVNDKIGQALGKELNVNMKNVPNYKVPFAAMKSKMETINSKLNLALNNATKDGDITDEEIMALKKVLYPGDDAVATQIAQTTDAKQRQDMIRNYVLFGTTQPQPQDQASSGPMTGELWKNIVSTLTDSSKLIEEFNKSATTVLNEELKELDKIRQKDERPEQQSAQPGQEGQTQQTKNNAQKLYNAVQEILNDYQLNALNSFANTMFKTYYAIYKQIVDAYRQQNWAQKKTAPNAEGAPAAEGGETPAAGATPAPAGA